MKHVREDLPDVQAARPEVSARLAAVLDRMTEKDLALRHPDAAAVEADLEDALAAEASRTGTSTGEATAVLRTLPADARRRLPLRLRMRVPVLLLVLMIAVAGSLVYLVLDQAADRTQRGTGPGHEHAAARRADRLGQADVGVRLRPARRRRGARGGGAARRRPGLRDRLDDRDLPERHADQAARGPSRASASTSTPSRPSTAAGWRSRRPSPAGRWRSTARREAVGRVAERRLDEARRRDGREPQAELQARHGRPPLPLLPRLDHRAAARQRPRRDHAAHAAARRRSRAKPV